MKICSKLNLKILLLIGFLNLLTVKTFSQEKPSLVPLISMDSIISINSKIKNHLKEWKKIGHYSSVPYYEDFNIINIFSAIKQEHLGEKDSIVKIFIYKLCDWNFGINSTYVICKTKEEKFVFYYCKNDEYNFKYLGVLEDNYLTTHFGYTSVCGNEIENARNGGSILELELYPDDSFYQLSITLGQGFSDFQKAFLLSKVLFPNWRDF